MQSVFPLLKQSDSAKAAFKFDGEFSVVIADFNVVNRKEVVDPSVMKLKQELEHVGRINSGKLFIHCQGMITQRKVSSERLVSFLDGGGISIWFWTRYPVPTLRDVKAQDQDQTSIVKFTKDMQCELEIAMVPDYSHPFVPGQRTIVRFCLANL